MLTEISTLDVLQTYRPVRKCRTVSVFMLMLNCLYVYGQSLSRRFVNIPLFRNVKFVRVFVLVLDISIHSGGLLPACQAINARSLSPALPNDYMLALSKL